MRVLLVESSRINNSNGICVHVRNAIVIQKYLSKFHTCKLVDDSFDIDIKEQYDFIIFISATFYFKFEKFVQLVQNQKKCKVGFLTNEIDLFASTWLKNLGFDFMITNFDESGVKDAHKIYKNYLMTNLNALQAKPRNPFIEKKFNCIQYSSYRKWREKYYQKYLIKDMVLSCSSKNVKKFLLTGADCLLTEPLSWEEGNETLNLFKSSLYLEDTVTHKVYNHLANRFYEALYCNCAVFFDESCLGTIKRANYIIDDYFIVDSYDELMDKTINLDEAKLKGFLERNSLIAAFDQNLCLNEIEDFLEKIKP